AVAADLAIYSAHTNLDVAARGVNDALAQVLGLQNSVPLAPLQRGGFRGRRPGGSAGLCAHPHLWPGGESGAEAGLGRLGELAEECSLRELAHRVKERLGAARVLWAGEPDRPVRRLAVCGGRGGRLIPQAAARGADAFLTGDLDYHEWQEARRLGLAVLDAGHAATEAPILPPLAAYLQARIAGAAGEEGGGLGRVEVFLPEEDVDRVETV
ncbi:MAG: Nif3-like dinuclear metal center hexameric protein, partial [Bacillota bacterium]|nr:Nif3-like dinuclear metal center hexameric protein [Bacillota bacterium]